LISAMFIGCEDDRFTPYIANIDDCHFSLDLDSVETVNRLIGTWKWVYEDQLTLNGYVGTTTSHLGLSIQIKSNGELVIYNNEVVEVTTWTIKPEAGGSAWILNTHPFHGYTYGPLRFCDDYFAVRNSLTDASDDYYQKVDETAG